MQRFGQIIKVKPECIAEYKRLHAAVYPGVLATIHACNMRNYSIFRHGTCLFAYFEYVGADIAVDMKKMAELWSTLAAAALQFSLRDSRITSTIVGISRPERLAETVELAEYPIPTELWTELAAIRDRGISA